MLIIATKPGRTVKNPKNRVQKYAQVQSNGSFKFVTDPDKATLFRSASDLLHAIGVRARLLKNGTRYAGVTHDLTWAEAQTSGVQVTRIANGA